MKIALITSSYNNVYTGALKINALKEFQNKKSYQIIEKVVPGVFEIPWGILEVFQSDSSIKGFCALGLILEGETKHGELITKSVYLELLNIQRTIERPITNGILICDNSRLAWERCHRKRNKGGEAAKALLELLSFKK
jgi:6,7-dimethyl-8-ribityllumazine synthase